MTDDPQSLIQLSLSIPILCIACGISYTLKLCIKQRFYFWCGLWKAYLLPSYWDYLNFHSTSWLCIFVLPVVFTLIHFTFNLSSLEILFKIKPLDIWMITEAKKRRVQNPSICFFIFCKINVEGFECFRCVCNEFLSRISRTMLTYG